jgi:hypothetical protein
MRGRALAGLVVLVALLMVAPAANAAPSGGCAGTSGVVTCTFEYTDAPELWTVPSGVDSVSFDVFGAQGGQLTYLDAPEQAQGAEVQGTLATTGGEQLQIIVAGKGQDDRCTGNAAGGFGGGGNGGNGQEGDFEQECGAGGGGASDVRTSPFGLANRLLVAGGGGGGGGVGSTGAAGGISGANGATADAYGAATTVSPSGSGATLAGIGAGGNAAGNSCAIASGDPGSGGTGGNGGNGGNVLSSTDGGGGGGGGYYGGGGGASGNHDGGPCEQGGGGGGGGSSYPNPASPPTGVSDVTINQGVHTGNGSVTATFTASGPPTTAIATPADGATLIRGTTVDADYSCADLSGSGISSCTGTVATGSGSFTVTATSTDGLTTSTTVHYTVVNPPPPAISITSPASGATFPLGANVTASFSCTDPLAIVLSCAGTAANGAPLDTETPGGHSLTVTTADNFDDTNSRTVSYEVSSEQLKLPKLATVAAGRATFRAACTGTVTGCAITVRNGHTVVATGSGNGSVTLKLTKAGSRMLNRSFRPIAVSGSATAGTTTVTASGELVRSKQTFTVRPSSFVAGTAKLTAKAKRTLERLRKDVGEVRRITCTGRGQLGLERARAVGRIFGRHARAKRSSGGASGPVTVLIRH